MEKTVQTDIKKKTKLGMVWNALERIVGQASSFILGIILARLLTPEDYGIIGMLSIFLSFSNVFIDSGFSRALIQKQDRSETDYSTTLIFNIVVSSFIYLLLFIFSPAIARFYETPELVSLQRVFFLIIIFNSLSVVQNSKLQIEVNFKYIAIVNSGTTILAGIAGIIGALLNWGPWALVFQQIVKSISSSLCYWIIGRWIPKTGFSWKSFKNLFGFGSKLLLSSLLGTALNKINDLVIGKVYSKEKLGFYSRAQQFPDIATGTLTSVLNTTTFPLMATLQNDRDELGNALRRIIQISSMVVFPAMIGIAVLSEPIVLTILGEKWAFSAELLFWLSLSSIFVVHNSMNMSVLNAIGRSDLFLKVDLCKVPFILLVMAITYPISLKAIVIGQAIATIIYFIINAWMPGKLFGFGPIKQLLCSWKYLLSTVIMGTVVFFLNGCIESNLLSLCVCIPVGAGVYATLLALMKDNEFFIMLEKIKAKLRK